MTTGTSDSMTVENPRPSSSGTSVLVTVRRLEGGTVRDRATVIPPAAWNRSSVRAVSVADGALEQYYRRRKLGAAKGRGVVAGPEADSVADRVLAGVGA